MHGNTKLKKKILYVKPNNEELSVNFVAMEKQQVLDISSALLYSCPSYPAFK
jgi:hypothetical protein